MIEYSMIIGIALTQIGVYLWMDKRSFNLSKNWVLIGILITQLFIFPKITFLLYGLNDRECGMPILGLQLFFLLLGGGLNLISHFTYYIIERNTKKHKL